ncbi:MAG: hypothetical protein PWQ75_1950 [Methanolobus sp.]|jgi:hypothetical protein|nr:hypothetical protein [Methanolobus sp.]MDK2832198.1 hypothetical protein [Methanolobus sp.]
MHSFYGFGIDYSNIWVEVIIFVFLIFGFKLLAAKKMWKLNTLYWILIVFISFLVTNAISSLI